MSSLDQGEKEVKSVQSLITFSCEVEIAVFE